MEGLLACPVLLEDVGERPVREALDEPVRFQVGLDRVGRGLEVVVGVITRLELEFRSGRRSGRPGRAGW